MRKPIMPGFRRALMLLLLLGIAGCAWQNRLALDRAFGVERPRMHPVAAAGSAIDFRRDVKPILDSRCAVCHGCYDAPCQLNLTAYEGIDRGANKAKVYDGSRLIAARLTRLFEDARTTPEWRERSFYPVLNEREQTPQANLAGGVMARILQLKHDRPLPRVDRLPDNFDFSLDRKQQCPRIEEFDSFAESYPDWGMPYGLPGLNAREHRTVLRWLELGAPDSAPDAIPTVYRDAIAEWEQFLNGSSLKEQLMSRYVYEHLFLGHLHFSEHPGGPFFRIVRSRTPPGQKADPIFTRRPYDDPGVPRVYYRIEPAPGTMLAKTHMPYALNAARMALWRALFLEAPYSVVALPSYRPEVASNPFVAYQAIPVRSRYRFMLDEAQFIVMGFIKGPVCRGQVALNVIDDRFWAVFLDPDSEVMARSGDFLAQQSGNLRLPAEEESNPLLLTTWLRYSSAQNRQLQAKQRKLEESLPRRESITLKKIWNGDGTNPNAALTIFRHFDSASVVQGLVGEPPKTAWVVTYSLLERIHYLLVAGFDVYGNVGHQLFSRLYMDFLRMEGEFNFLILLPKEIRTQIRDFWYRDASQEVKDYLLGQRIDFRQQTGIPYATRDPKTELFGMLRARLAPVLDRSHDLDRVEDPRVREPLRRLTQARGPALSLMPETSFVEIVERSSGSTRTVGVYTLLEDAARANISHLFKERRLPAEDRMTVAPGFIGAYPNAFFKVDVGDLPRFVDAITRLGSEADFGRLLTEFGVRRTHPDFWAHSDALHQISRTQTPIEAGLFDYNRFENR
ncbi:fatty acid cis/trans isomerase [Methylotetracoccus oryzae]|uniref:fatty acid cis/trans isomerase n=1 Tax=Methylotetracoccus oryzae TaxID=1919059 RepID=UPI001F27AFA3|nr:fatty acid cis/trans isomerase [Methylotetracoccus oryzae]